MIKRFHCSLKTVLRACLASTYLVQHLPLVLLVLCSAPRDNSRFFPAKAVYGSTLSLPVELLGLPEFPPDILFQKVFRHGEKFFVLQVRDKTEPVSVNRLKPEVSSSPVTSAVLPPQGRPWLQPASFNLPADPVCLQKKKVWFLVPVPPAMQLRQNPCQMFQGLLPLSAILRPHLLWGGYVATKTTLVHPLLHRNV